MLMTKFVLLVCDEIVYFPADNSTYFQLSNVSESASSFTNARVNPISLPVSLEGSRLCVNDDWSFTSLLFCYNNRRMIYVQTFSYIEVFRICPCSLDILEKERLHDLLRAR